MTRSDRIFLALILGFLALSLVIFYGEQRKFRAEVRKELKFLHEVAEKF